MKERWKIKKRWRKEEGKKGAIKEEKLRFAVGGE